MNATKNREMYINDRRKKLLLVSINCEIFFNFLMESEGYTLLTLIKRVNYCELTLTIKIRKIMHKFLFWFRRNKI